MWFWNINHRTNPYPIQNITIAVFTNSEWLTGLKILSNNNFKEIENMEKKAVNTATLEQGETINPYSNVDIYLSINTKGKSPFLFKMPTWQKLYHLENIKNGFITCLLLCICFIPYIYIFSKNSPSFNIVGNPILKPDKCSDLLSVCILKDNPSSISTAKFNLQILQWFQEKIINITGDCIQKTKKQPSSNQEKKIIGELFKHSDTIPKDRYFKRKVYIFETKACDIIKEQLKSEGFFVQNSYSFYYLLWIIQVISVVFLLCSPNYEDQLRYLLGKDVKFIVKIVIIILCLVAACLKLPCYTKTGNFYCSWWIAYISQIHKKEKKENTIEDLTQYGNTKISETQFNEWIKSNRLQYSSFVKDLVLPYLE